MSGNQENADIRKAIRLKGPVPAYCCKHTLSGRFIVVTSNEEAKHDFYSEVKKFERVADARLYAYECNYPKWGSTVYTVNEPPPVGLTEALRTAPETAPKPE